MQHVITAHAKISRYSLSEVNHICKHQRAIVLAENYALVVTKQQKLKSQNIEPMIHK